MLSPDTFTPDVSLKNITLHIIIVRINNAAIATVFIFPRFVIPITTQRIIRAPITRHHTQFPVLNIPFAASAPS